MTTSSLSGRTCKALMQQQQQLSQRANALRRLDNLLSGSLIACSEGSQAEMLASYLEALQDLRVDLQRLEQFLLSRLPRERRVSELADDFGTGTAIASD